MLVHDPITSRSEQFYGDLFRKEAFRRGWQAAVEYTRHSPRFDDARERERCRMLLARVHDFLGTISVSYADLRADARPLMRSVHKELTR